MTNTTQQTQKYNGFEQGPIRPPSEAHSLLIRITRNCPWNRCTFCPLYKKSYYSVRPLGHVLKDIDKIHQLTQILAKEDKCLDRWHLKDVPTQAYVAANRWIAHDMESIFLQDSNSLAINSNDLIAILHHIKNCFPHVKRITSYARSSTINKISLDTLKEIHLAGLTRIHIGLESGSNTILKQVCKGATKEIHISAGKKVKAAGFELSEYIMPGLGGQELSIVHATETADAINQINPDFIRLRPLAIPHQITYNQPFSSSDFKICTDHHIVKELHQFISQLDGITSTLLSDHILNLFADLHGTFPQDKNTLLHILEAFQQLPIEKQQLYQLGRRMGIFSGLKDLHDKQLTSQVQLYVYQFKSMNKSIDEITCDLLKRYI